MKFREEKIESALSRLAGEFILIEANPSSLITVTAVQFEERANRAKIFVTVFPDDAEENAISFLNRKRHDFQEYLKEHIRMRAIPSIIFIPDEGEKNRQRIDEIANGSKKTEPDK